MLHTTLLLLLLAGDDTTFEKPKPKPRAKPKPVVVEQVKTPSPLCFWSPKFTDPCDCWFWNSESETFYTWKPCLPRDETPVFEENSTTDLTTIKTITHIEVVKEPAPPEPFRMSLQGWTLAGFSGEADSEFTYGGRIEVDGPIATFWTTKTFRMFGRLDLGTLPGETTSFSSVDTFSQSATFRGGAYLQLAESFPTNQRITTSVIGWAGFATMFADEVLDRYLRSFGIGVRLAEEVSGANITLSYCRDEAGGYIGVGQICVGGSVPIIGTDRTLILGGNALLNLSRATVSQQRDTFTLYLGVDVGEIVR